MVHALVSILLFSSIKIEIEEKIIFLKDTTKRNSVNIITETLASYLRRNKITSHETNIILAMSYAESSFENIVGSMGEVGFLQVLPQDQHIKDIYCSLYTNCEVTKNSSKFRTFLLSNPQLSFELGIMEFLFWKEQYEKKLKKLYWETFPVWALRGLDQNELDRVKNEWLKTKSLLGDYVFILHYNWGGRFLSSKSAWGYFTKVYSVFRKIHNYSIEEGRLANVAG